MGGGEGDDQNKKTLVRKQMAEFSHMEQINRLNKKKNQRGGAPSADCRQVAQQVANNVFMSCRNDVAALLRLLESYGAFNNVKVKDKLLAMKKRYQL